MDETLALAARAEPGMLGEAELALVARVRDAYRDAGAVGCTSCRYCMPCPFGVSIPEVFDWYNEWKTIRHTLGQRVFYLSTVGGALSGKNGLASKCTSCGVCLEKCPQSLPIPDLMSMISKEYEGGLGRTMEGFGAIVQKVLNPRKKS
jgi:predicted aldo/keto reductase-like oxidoreductase